MSDPLPTTDRRKPSRAMRWPIAAVCAVALGWVLMAFGRQYVQFYGMRRDNDRVRRDVLVMKAQQQRLRIEQATLTTPQGMEREARRLGYLRDGEARLSVPE